MRVKMADIKELQHIADIMCEVLPESKCV